MTQAQLAQLLGVSSKAVSKWETARGLPDITLIEPLAKALSVSVMELISGDAVTNRNLSANVLRSKFYVCPVCRNIIRSMGDAVLSCCGITLPPLEAEEMDDEHTVTIEPVEDEHFITVHHEMTKAHYISFIAWLTTDRVQFVKLYPESDAQTRLGLRGRGYLYIYCNKHGLMRQKI
jgi:desulfoferrodoxin (superoxide reductase-like protein)/DNA-binding XRE family transcriptional regulator